MADQYQNQAEMFGITPDSPHHHLTVLTLKVQDCAERRGVDSCEECPHNFFCEVRTELLQLHSAATQE